MAINKQQKEQLVSELSAQMNESKSTVFVNYTGMGVKAMQELRRQLRENGASVVIAKNTLIKLAGEKAGVPSDALTDTVLTQQTAVIFANEDAVGPIQILGKYIKENELPAVKAGIVEGQFQSKDGILAISKLPGREVLYAQVVGAAAAPMYAVAGILQANIQKLLFVIQTKAQGGE